MDPIPRVPPRELPLPPPHKGLPAAVIKRISAVCDKVLSSNISRSESEHYIRRLRQYWIELKSSGTITPDLTKKIQATANKLKSTYSDIVIPEDLMNLSKEIDTHRFEQTCTQLEKGGKFLSPPDLIDLVNELHIYSQKEIHPEEIGSPISHQIEKAASFAAHRYGRDPPKEFVRLQRMNFDRIYTQLQTSRLSRENHTLILKEFLRFSGTLLGQRVSPKLRSQILFIAEQLQSVKYNPHVATIIEKISADEPILILSPIKGSQENFNLVHAYLLQRAPISMKETKELTNEFLEYWRTHQFGVSLDRAQKMRDVANTLLAVWDNPKLEEISQKITECLEAYQLELDDAQ